MNKKKREKIVKVLVYFIIVIFLLGMLPMVAGIFK